MRLSGLLGEIGFRAGIGALEEAATAIFIGLVAGDKGRQSFLIKAFVNIGRRRVGGDNSTTAVFGRHNLRFGAFGRRHDAARVSAAGIQMERQVGSGGLVASIIRPLR